MLVATAQFSNNKMKSQTNVETKTMNNENMNQLLAAWREGDYSGLMGAVYAINADPACVEDEADAEAVANFIAKNDLNFHIYSLSDAKEDVPSAYEYYALCQQLDLLAAHTLVEFSNGTERLLLCLSADLISDNDPETLYRSIYPFFSAGCSTDEWDDTLLEDVTYDEACRFIEQRMSDRGDESLRSLQAHSTGGIFWVEDAQKQEYVTEFPVAHVGA